MAWDRIRPRLTTRSAWIDHDGELPIIGGTLIRLQMDHLPRGGDPLPVWLWSSKTGMPALFIAARHGAAPRYPNPDLEPMLNDTYGVVIWPLPTSGLTALSVNCRNASRRCPRGALR